MECMLHYSPRTVATHHVRRFRLVALQMDDIQDCLKVRDVKQKLKELPRGLEETYERILARSIHPGDLLHMLHWLAFSARALRLQELAEVVSIDLDAQDAPSYDPDGKYGNSSIALAVCSGLVTEINGKYSSTS